MRLLEVYQKAYIRDKSYTAWINGSYSAVAYKVVLGNAFGDSKTTEDYPNWDDPIKHNVSVVKNNEIEARKEQLRQNAWFSNMLHKK